MTSDDRKLFAPDARSVAALCAAPAGYSISADAAPQS